MSTQDFELLSDDQEYAGHQPSHHLLLYVISQLDQERVAIKKASIAVRLINPLIETELRNHAKEQFLFFKYNYAGADQHVIEHQCMIAKLRHFQKELKANGHEAVEILQMFLTNWVKKHVQESDQNFNSFIKQQETKCIMKSDLFPHVQDIGDDLPGFLIS